MKLALAFLAFAVPALAFSPTVSFGLQNTAFKMRTETKKHLQIQKIMLTERGQILPLFSSVKPSDSSRVSSWKEKLLKISNIASLLCAIDCTILPIITLFLPLIGLGLSPDQGKWLHELGHQVALFFVLPVGGLAASMNYFSHKKIKLLSMSALGLIMVYAANGHGGPILSYLPRQLAHDLHCCTLLHKGVNIIGCGMLLGSNYFAHKLGCTSHDHQGGCCEQEKSHFYPLPGKNVKGDTGYSIF